MFLKDKKLLNRIINNDDLKSSIEELEKELNKLKENIIHGQQISKTGSWTHDILKDEIFLTDEVYNILGCNQKEFDGKLENYYLFIHPDDLQEVKAATQEALEGKEYDIEYRIITPDGVQKYVHEKTKALYGEEKNQSK